MLGLVVGTWPSRQLGLDKKSARRKNQNIEGTPPVGNAVQNLSLRGALHSARLKGSPELTTRL